LRNDGWNFQKLTKVFPESMLDRNTWIVNFVNLPSSFHAKRQGGGGWRFFKKKTYSLPYLHKNFKIVHQLSHPTFRRKPSANLYACQDQVSCI
jgi:hypothetical protein